MWVFLLRTEKFAVLMKSHIVTQLHMLRSMESRDEHEDLVGNFVQVLNNHLCSELLLKKIEKIGLVVLMGDRGGGLDAAQRNPRLQQPVHKLTLRPHVCVAELSRVANTTDTFKFKWFKCVHCKKIKNKKEPSCGLLFS